MDLRHAVRAIVLAPKRFLDWVYAPSARHAPTRSQAIVHLHVAATGMDSTRWMSIESEERRYLAALLRARERAAPEAAGAADPVGTAGPAGGSHPADTEQGAGAR